MDFRFSLLTAATQGFYPSDVTGPTLSAAQDGTPTTDGTVGAGVTTNEGNGTLYWAVVTNGGSCTDAQLKTGSGGNIVAGKAGNQAVSASGAQVIATITGLAASTAYQIKFLHRDAAGNDSSQASVDLTTAASATYATWNPSDKAANITLSNGNLTAADAGGFDGVRSTIGKAVGKWYWEYTVTAVGSAQISGVANSTQTLVGEYIGQGVNGWAYYNDGSKVNSGPSAYGATYTTGDVVGVALNMDAGTITFYKNNVSQGQAFSGITGTIYAATSLLAATITANFGATALTYSPPSGFNAGLYT